MQRDMFKLNVPALNFDGSFSVKMFERSELLSLLKLSQLVKRVINLGFSGLDSHYHPVFYLFFYFFLLSICQCLKNLFFLRASEFMKKEWNSLKFFETLDWLHLVRVEKQLKFCIAIWYLYQSKFIVNIFCV